MECGKGEGRSIHQMRVFGRMLRRAIAEQDNVGGMPRWLPGTSHSGAQTFLALASFLNRGILPIPHLAAAVYDGVRMA